MSVYNPSLSLFRPQRDPVRPRPWLGQRHLRQQPARGAQEVRPGHGEGRAQVRIQLPGVRPAARPEQGVRGGRSGGGLRSAAETVHKQRISSKPTIVLDF